MSKINSIRNLYGFDYYESASFNSSLTDWYNRVIDKSIDELDAMDVAKITRQSVLKDIKDVAVDRAIELFLANPFDGELQDGDLLNVLVSCSAEVVKNKRVDQLTTVIFELENEISQYEWPNE